MGLFVIVEKVAAIDTIVTDEFLVFVTSWEMLFWDTRSINVFSRFSFVHLAKVGVSVEGNIESNKLPVRLCYEHVGGDGQCFREQKIWKEGMACLLDWSYLFRSTRCNKSGKQDGTGEKRLHHERSELYA